MSAGTRTLEPPAVGAVAAAAPAAAAGVRSRAWAIVGALSVTETVSWGVLYYAFAVFLVPMQADLGFSAAQLTGGFSLAVLVSAALASFIFLPLTQTLIDGHGWRDALVILAAILAVITVPLHALILRRAPDGGAHPDEGRRQHPPPSVDAATALRAAQFWLLSLAFVLASLAAIAMTVHAIPFLLERGWSPASAAFAVGLIGVSQIPGRLLFGPLAARLPPGRASASVFALMALGLAVTVSSHVTAVVLAGLILLGMGNGMATLARANAIADIYGPRAFGTIAGVAGSMTTAARAGGPVAAAVYAAALGYDALLWSLVALGVLAAALALREEAA